MTRGIRSLVFAIVAFSIARCSDVEQRPFPEHYSFENAYLLQVRTLQVGDDSVSLHRDPSRGINFVCGDADRFRICLNPDVYEIFVEVSNLSNEDISIPWNEARFIDDSGASRRVDTKLPNARLPSSLDFPDRTTTVPPRWSTVDSVWPEGKVYYANATRENSYVMYEPLVPGRLTGSRDQDRAALDEMAAGQVPLKLFLVILVEGQKTKVEATMNLVDRAEAVEEYQLLLSDVAPVDDENDATSGSGDFR